MDRTAEFFSTVDILRATARQDEGQGRGSTRLQVPRAKPSAHSTRVRATAREIGRLLRLTGKLVDDLHGLVRRRSLFNDPAQQITETRQLVKTNLSKLGKQLAAFVKLAAASPDGQGCREHWIQVAEVLKLRLMACTRGLQEALQVRARNIKAQQRRKLKFDRSNWTPLVQLDAPMFSLPPEQQQQQQRPQTAGAPAPGQQYGQRHRSADAAGSQAPVATAGAYPVPATAANQRRPEAPSMGRGATGAGGGVAALPDHHRRRKAAGRPGLRHRGPAPPASTVEAPVVPMMQPPLMAPSYMTPDSLQAQSRMAAQQRARNRTQEAQQVESSIVELGHMFTHLSHLVADQRVLAQDIESNMLDAETHARKGQMELIKWLQDVNKHRGFILKLFALLVVFILLFAWLKRGT